MIATPLQTRTTDSDSQFDWQVHALAKAALAASKYSAIRKLSCRVLEGVVEITGTVPSFYLKQLAQAAVLQLEGAAEIRNLVHVGEPATLVARDCHGVA